MSEALRSTRDVIVQVRDWAGAIRFYEQVLGLQVTHRSDRMVGFETGSFCLYVEPGEREGPVFEYLAGDVQQTKRRLLEAGCVLEEEDPAVPRVYVRDPFGIVFNIGPLPPAAKR